MSKETNYIVVIPARYASTRLPGKLLAEIAGKPLIAHVVERAQQSAAQRVIVATDDQRIAAVLQDATCEVCLTHSEHKSGSDRLAEVMEKLTIDDDTVVVNVQGDEPLIPPQLIDQVAAKLNASPQAVMATAAHPITTVEDFRDPNVVKVVFDQQGKALYFSRASIPYDIKPYIREPQETGQGETGQYEDQAIAWHHIGIYAYRAEFLKRYNLLQPSALEESESLEQLRVMDNGESIMVEPVDYDAGFGVDSEQDLQRVRDIFRSNGA